VEFTAKISVQGDRYFIQIPKAYAALAAKNKGKYMKWVGLPLDAENNLKNSHKK
jgi:hypothetical protein